MNVFPNFKHQNRKDGYGCRKLSPMYLGPVEHGQPNLPPSKNIENFHQFSKVFQEEVDKDGNPSKLFYKNRLSGYLDDTPHRHKFKGKEKNKNIPLYFMWVDKDGKEHRLDYITSRQFYCNFYARLASEKKDFKHLVELINKGYNIQICGYDANPIHYDEDNLVENIEKEYLNPDAPFGAATSAASWSGSLIQPARTWEGIIYYVDVRREIVALDKA